ncbi:hypothetical protein BGZ70_003798 [Mortierella alpina]|uniref:Transferase n=1 Tax=Mortierella alpina TaxID=64518 RepID=A0A9P6JAA7_MORAP|nr:hypothetical protein BGZ70_003798 [Mortierella alpina]
MTLESCIVLPTSKHGPPPPPAAVLLHELDLISPPMQIHNHRFYRPAAHRSASAVIDTLKTALAEALELCPPVAGTVRTNDQGQPCIAMDAENIQGTPFQVCISDTPYEGDSEDLSPRTDILLPPLSSSLAVKVTQFSCGTIAVGSSIHHQVADLCAFLEFLELWALIARGETIDFATIPDDWSRNPGRFFPKVEPAAKTLPPPPPFTVLPAPASGPPASLMQPSVITRWKFSQSSLRHLKADISPIVPTEHPSGLWISSGDALASLLCGAITRARNDGNVPRVEGRTSADSPYENLVMAADGRGRAPEGNMANGRYYGNFNPLWNATVSRSDLLSLSCEAASRVAVAIRSALNLQLSPEAIARKISFFEDPLNNQPSGRIVWTADIILTNWCRFDLQGPKLDFGWGKPFRSTSGGVTAYPPGYCIMTEDKDSGEVSVMLTIEHAAENGLKADLLLNKYAVLDLSPQ